ncbi:MAG: STAS domain-containing protein [Pseudonocardiales bacterium]|nr:STAS domain-containing protein [Pseudonocardiales bacterium]MBV9651305.1 STAS domain-containing protein [Pseudonocardiales bacterium]
MTNTSDPTRWQADPLDDTQPPPWKLSVRHYPAVGICAVVVEGELDSRTAPLLEQCVHQQLLAAPEHLIVDLVSVRFVDSGGLNCLLRARQLTQLKGMQLHLAGLITRAAAVPMRITGLPGVFSTYPTLTHAVDELAGCSSETSPHVVPPRVFTAFWRRLMGNVWILELCDFHAGDGRGAVMDWINSGVPASQPAPDTAAELLGAHGLWLFSDAVKGSATGGRHRIGYACADVELAVTAHLLRDDAAEAGVHPVILGAWVMAGYSTATAAGWIRAGCLLPC